METLRENGMPARPGSRLCHLCGVKGLCLGCGDADEVGRPEVPSQPPRRQQALAPPTARHLCVLLFAFSSAPPPLLLNFLPPSLILISSFGRSGGETAESRRRRRASVCDRRTAGLWGLEKPSQAPCVRVTPRYGSISFKTASECLQLTCWWTCGGVVCSML